MSCIKHNKNSNKTKDVRNRLYGSIDSNTIVKLAMIWFPLFDKIIDSEKDLHEILSEIVDLYHHLILHRGVTEGTKRFKAIRQYTIKWILNMNPEAVPCLSLYKDGFPRDLRIIRKYSKEDNIQFVYSILNITRLTSVIDRNKSQSYASIRKQPDRNEKFRQVLSEFSEDLPKILKDLGIKSKDPNTFEVNFFSSTSKGPNSKSGDGKAILDSHLDAKALVKDKSLWKSFCKVANHMNVLGLTFYIQDLANKVNKDGLVHSRLAIIPDPENKERIVAICDYFSQMIFVSVEKHLRVINKSLTNSFMYDQDKGRARARDFTIEGNPVSLDATAFTDRFPREIQMEVLKQLTNEEFSKDYFSLLCSRGFKAPRYEKLVWYGAGQPMGAHSSFHLANITHCLFSIHCMRKHYVDLNIQEIMNLNAIVGDDIVFKHNEPSVIYSSKMNSLGVKFSEMKGYTSNGNQLIAEFCKRLYLNGKQINGFTPRPATNFARDYKHVTSLVTAYGLSDDQLEMIVSHAKPNQKDRIFELIWAQRILLSNYTPVLKDRWYKYLQSPLQDLIDMWSYIPELIVHAMINLLRFNFLWTSSGMIFEDNYSDYMRADKSQFNKFSGKTWNPITMEEVEIPISKVAGFRFVPSELLRVEEGENKVSELDIQLESGLKPFFWYIYEKISALVIFNNKLITLYDDLPIKFNKKNLILQLLVDFNFQNSYEYVNDLWSRLYMSPDSIQGGSRMQLIARIDSSASKDRDKLLFFLCNEFKSRLINESIVRDNLIFMRPNPAQPAYGLPYYWKSKMLE